VVFYGTFRPSLEELTIAGQGVVMTTMLELTEAPDSPGLNVHRAGNASAKCWSARVNDDVRFVFFRAERTVVPPYVSHYDEAYRWAEGARWTCTLRPGPLRSPSSDNAGKRLSSGSSCPRFRTRWLGSGSSTG